VKEQQTVTPNASAQTCLACGMLKRFCGCGAYALPTPTSDPSLKQYTVHVQPRFPAYDEIKGWDLTFWAASKKEAVAKARRETANGGHTGRRDYTATEVKKP
jgi:hypothetical protein